MAILTQRRYGLSGRRYGDFATKIAHVTGTPRNLASNVQRNLASNVQRNLTGKPL